MATSHAISVVKSHCYKAPRISKTDRPATATEFNQEGNKHDFEQESELMDEENNVLPRVSTQTSTVGWHARTKHGVTSLNHGKGDVVNEEEFYQNLVRLREEHKKTLKLLETKYYDELRNQNSFQWQGFSHGVGLKQQLNGFVDDSTHDFEQSFDSVAQYRPQENGDRVLHKPPKSPAVRDVVKDLSRSAIASGRSEREDDESEDSDEDENNSEQNKELGSPEEFSSSLFPKRSAAIDMVEDLWKDFSVRDYTMEDESLVPEERRKPKEKEWSPVITVPKPFTMTLREATKEKRKTRSMKMVEEDLVLKRSMEEAELRKKFRAQPAPATTFLPLYDDIVEKNNRRSEHVREINKAILKATEKPFNFVKREDEKKRRKEEQEKWAAKYKIKDEVNRAAFKARPPPKHMDDLTLADRLTEQDEYRKIRKKLRSAELLAKSRLPPSMEARANISPAAKSRKKCRKSRDETKPKFRPNINTDVPDFEALHWEFEKDLRRKKKERQPTVVEPFNLRTAHIPRGEGSLRRARSMENLSQSVDSPMLTRKSRPFSARLSSSQDTLPFGTTESVRLRDSALRKSLDLRKQRENESTREVKEKRKREKKLRSHVSVRAMANDHSWLLRKTSEEKLKTFRENDRGRKEEYEHELAEMQRRIAQRPLLLEQESQANAKRKAEKKYTQILLDAGVGEHLVSKLVTKDGRIVDDDDSCDEDGVHFEDKDDEDLNENREYSAAQQNGGTLDRDSLSDRESEEDNESEVDSVDEY